MTALLELERIARAAVAPEGSIDVVAVVDGTPCTRLANGAPSGIGGTTRFGAAWFDGLHKSEPIALFERQADAFTLINLLTGRTLRSAPHFVAGMASVAGPAEGGAVPSTRPRSGDSTSRTPAGGGLTGVAGTTDAGSPGVTLAPPGLLSGPALAPDPGPACAACGRSFADLPPSRMRDRRRTCSDACRQAYRRGHRAPVAGVVALEDLARLSRLPRPFHPGIDAEERPLAPDASQPEPNAPAPA